MTRIITLQQLFKNLHASAFYQAITGNGNFSNFSSNLSFVHNLPVRVSLSLRFIVTILSNSVYCSNSSVVNKAPFIRVNNVKDFRIITDKASARLPHSV